jgi:hypothetical protein
LPGSLGAAAGPQQAWASSQQAAPLRQHAWAARQQARFSEQHFCPFWQQASFSAAAQQAAGPVQQASCCEQQSLAF